MDHDELLIDLRTPVAFLTFNRPRTRNAFTLSLGKRLVEAVDELRRTPDVRAVVIRGEGAGFSAGGDFKFIEARAQDSAPENREAMLAFYRLFLSVRELPMPVIAAMHGSAVGAGLCLSLACDFRLAAENTRFAFNFVRIGLHPGMGATYFLPRLVGPGKASELLLTGRTIDAAEALRIGLVHEVVPEGALQERALSLASELSEAAPVAVAQTKATLRQSLSLELDQALELEAGAQAIDYGTQDLAEAIAAFRGKRPPRFRGR